MTTEQFEIRELRKRETDEMLKLRNSIFGNISREHWDRMDCTAAVAIRDGRFMGAIPLQFREQLIRPHLSIPVVYENAVGVSAEARGTGIGTLMLDAAAEFVADRADALFVYRGDERSAGYRFYRKTGHGDLAYIRDLELTKPRGRANGIGEFDARAAYRIETGLLRVFSRVFGGHAGFRRRGRGYFEKAIGAHIYINDDWRLLLSKKGGTIDGYAIINPHDRLKKGIVVYDYAAGSRAVFGALLEKIASIAQKVGTVVTFPCVSPENPYYRHLIGAGYVALVDTPYVMSRVLNGGNVYRRLMGNSKVLARVKLIAETPQRDMTLFNPPRAKTVARIFLKENQLSRLLAARLDLKTALAMDIVRLSEVPKDVLAALCRTFRFTPWAHFRIDYV